MAHCCTLGAPTARQINALLELVADYVAGPGREMEIVGDTGNLPAVQVPTLGRRPCVYIAAEPAEDLEARIAAHLSWEGYQEDRTRTRRRGCFVRHLRVN